jgi:tetratricopeptide (TPR) repeat protein
MMSENADDLDRLLTPSDSPVDPVFRERLREETVRALRRGHQLRRLRNAAALAACYAAGLATVALLRPAPPPAVAPAPANELVEKQPPRPAAMEQSAAQLELLAEQADGGESARLYLAAARKFAGEQGSWEAALRCYRNALDADPEFANSIDPANDDWLMITLKNARNKERIYESSSN